jgi:hypothetical protein
MENILQSSYVKKSWNYLYQHFSSFFLLTTGGVFLMGLMVIMSQIQLPYLHELLIVLHGCTLVYAIVLQQNALDVVYGRSLRMFVCDSWTVRSALFFMIFSWFQPLSLFLLLFPLDVSVEKILIGILFLVIVYLVFKLSLVTLFMLEKKVPFMKALQKSFTLTGLYFHQLIILFIGLRLVLYVGIITIIGSFIALPFVLIMQALVFKNIEQDVIEKQ